MATQATQVAPRAPKPAAWDDYWPTEPFAADDRRALLIGELCQFFCSSAGWPVVARARPWYARACLELDWAELTALARSRDLEEAMHHAPAEALACLAAAVHEALFVRHPERAAAAGAAPRAPARVLVRLVNHAPSFLPVSAVRADQVGRLVTVRGTVARATPVRPLVTALQFVCAKCAAPQTLAFPDGRFQAPAACGADGCRGRTLAPNRAAAACADWQRLAVQGLPRDERGGEGRVPRPVDVELLDDLADSCAPGDVVTVTGLVKVATGEPASGEPPARPPPPRALPLRASIWCCDAGRAAAEGGAAHPAARPA
jgi:DNA helicase MCM8